MAIAEIETNRIVSDSLPARDLDADEIFRHFAAVLMAENIALSLHLGAWRPGAQCSERNKAFLAIVPADGDFGTDDLDVRGGMHGVNY